MWQYKEDLFGPGENKVASDPFFSNAWRKFIAPAERRGNFISSLSHDIDIQFVELRTAPIGSVDNLERAQEILKTLGENPRPFFDYLRTEVGSNAQTNIEEALRNTIPKFADLKDLSGGFDLINPIVIDAAHRSRDRAETNFVNQEKIQEAINILQQRINQRTSAEQRVEGGLENNFILVPGLTGRDNNGRSFGVFSRNRNLWIKSVYSINTSATLCP